MDPFRVCVAGVLSLTVGVLASPALAAPTAAPTTGTAPQAAGARPKPVAVTKPTVDPSVLLQFVSFERTNGTGAYSTGPIYYAVRISNPSATQVSTQLSVKRMPGTSGEKSLGVFPVDLPANGTRTVVVGDAHGLVDGCSPTRFSLHIANGPTKTAKTVPSCSFSAVAKHEVAAAADPPPPPPPSNSSSGGIAPGLNMPSPPGAGSVPGMPGDAVVKILSASVATANGCAGTFNTNSQVKNFSSRGVSMKMTLASPQGSGGASISLPYGLVANQTANIPAVYPFTGHAGDYRITTAGTAEPPAGFPDYPGQSGYPATSPSRITISVTRACQLAVGLD